LAPYGADDRVAALYKSYAAGLEPGRVVRVDRIRALVATAAGPVSATAPELPVVGDWVGLALPADEDQWATVEAVLPRWSELSRRASGPVPEAQVVAANVDLVFVVSTLDRPLSPNRIERELVVAWESGARPVVVLNKADASIADEGAVAELQDRLGLVDIVVTSARTGEGIDDLVAALQPARTAVLLGASGVGKSSLVNTLVGDEVAETGEVREVDQRGRHTTTARWLVPLPGGGVLLDTPGVRSIGLWDADEGIARTFPEIDELAPECRFRDCTHEGEPGCAITAAVESGALEAGRYESWRKLQRELAYEARAVDPQLQAEQRRKWKTIHKSLRAHQKPS
jgi:ribosome biogenesis GTPase